MFLGECKSFGNLERLFRTPYWNWCWVPFIHHTSFMTLPPSAILVSSHLIFWLVLLRMNGNITCLLIQFSYILTKTFIKTQGLLNISILYCLITLVSFYSLDDLVLEIVPNYRDVTDTRVSSPVSAQVYRHDGIYASWCS